MYPSGDTRKGGSVASRQAAAPHQTGTRNYRPPRPHVQQWKGEVPPAADAPVGSEESHGGSNNYGSGIHSCSQCGASAQWNGSAVAWPSSENYRAFNGSAAVVRPFQRRYDPNGGGQALASSMWGNNENSNGNGNPYAGGGGEATDFAYSATQGPNYGDPCDYPSRTPGSHPQSPLPPPPPPQANGIRRKGMQRLLQQRQPYPQETQQQCYQTPNGQAMLYHGQPTLGATSAGEPAMVGDNGWTTSTSNRERGQNHWGPLPPPPHSSYNGNAQQLTENWRSAYGTNNSYDPSQFHSSYAVQQQRQEQYPTSNLDDGRFPAVDYAADPMEGNGEDDGATPASDDNGESASAQTAFQPHDYYAETCKCPNCQQGAHIAWVFANQRQASRHVMLARPSPYHVNTGGLPPKPAPIPRSPLKRCPVFDAFGFCPYSAACFLRHITQPEKRFGEAAGSPRVARAESAEKEVERLIAKAAEHRTCKLWSCDVCGFEGIDERCVGIIGTTYYYRYCPQCTHHCYFPYITYLVEHILESVGDDYQQFKDLVNQHRERLPDEFKVPLSAEAHRVASIVFAWSLVSPRHVCDALEAAYKALPCMRAIVSIGSAAGYVEHLFNRVMHPDVPATQEGRGAQRKVAKSHFPTTSFDGVTAKLPRDVTIPIYAFDEIAMSLTYSVHVSIGGPTSVLGVCCPETVLLLCWPPFGAPDEEQSSMGFEALEYYTQNSGQVLIYIGDVSTTGDWRFHQLLYTHYKLVDDYAVRREVRRWCPAEMGYVFSGNDTIGVYKRRDAPVALPPNWTCTM